MNASEMKKLLAAKRNELKQIQSAVAVLRTETRIAVANERKAKRDAKAQKRADRLFAKEVARAARVEKRINKIKKAEARLEAMRLGIKSQKAVRMANQRPSAVKVYSDSEIAEYNNKSAA